MAAENGVGVTAIFSARGPAQVMSVERFEKTGARIEVLLDSDGSSAVENVELLLRQLRCEGRADAFFTCGSNRLMLLMQRLGRELGIPGQVALEPVQVSAASHAPDVSRKRSAIAANERQRGPVSGP